MKYFKILSGKCTTNRQRKCYRNSNSNLTFIALNQHWIVDSNVQQDHSNIQIQSPGTKTGQHHGETIRENDLRRISLCVEIGIEFGSKRGNSGWCMNVFRKRIPNSGSIKGKTEAKLLSGLVNFRLKLWNIKEIGNTLTMSSTVSIVVRGKMWSKIFREASMNKLVHQGSQFELWAKLNREPMEFHRNNTIPSGKCTTGNATVTTLPVLPSHP